MQIYLGACIFSIVQLYVKKVGSEQEFYYIGEYLRDHVFYNHDFRKLIYKYL